MDSLAKYLGLTEAVNHTGKMAYFTRSRGGYLKFVCHIKDFDPRENKDTFIALLDAVVKEGAEITVHHKNLKSSKYVRYEAVMEINKQIYRALGVTCQPAIVNTIRKFVENLERENKLDTT